MFLACITNGWEEYDARPNIYIINDLVSNFYAVQPTDDNDEEEGQIKTRKFEVQCHRRGLEENVATLEDDKMQEEQINRGDSEMQCCAISLEDETAL